MWNKPHGNVQSTLVEEIENFEDEKKKTQKYKKLWKLLDLLYFSLYFSNTSICSYQLIQSTDQEEYYICFHSSY